MLLPLVTPELVFAVGMFLLFTSAFGFIGLGTTAQVIGHVTFSLSWVVLIVRGRLVTIGPDVEEAAADLGAPPCTRSSGACCCRCSCPAIAASLLVAFALSIDDFVVAQYLASGADTTTVPMRIYAQARGAPTPALNALATIMLVVSLLALVLALARVPLAVARSGRRRVGSSRRSRGVDAMSARRHPARGAGQALRRRGRGRRHRPAHAGRRVLHDARPVGLRQDDDAAADRRASRRPTAARSCSTASTCRARRRTSGASTRCSRATRCSRT